MKQLQNTFLKAQKNAERNVKGKIYKYISFYLTVIVSLAIIRQSI